MFVQWNISISTQRFLRDRLKAQAPSLLPFSFELKAFAILWKISLFSTALYYWKKDYPIRQKLLHAVLYTLSFSTLLFWVFFPLDLFFVNMFFQFLMVRFTQTTIHGYLSGKMFTDNDDGKDEDIRISFASSIPSWSDVARMNAFPTLSWDFMIPHT